MNAPNLPATPGIRGQLLGLLLSLGLVVAIIGLASIGIRRVFASAGEFMIYDFQSPLIAAKAVVNGIDPYSEQVTSEIQEFVYGRSALSTEDALAFAYPLYVAYVLAPLTFIPIDWAQAIWLSLLLACALAGVFFCFKAWGWPRRPGTIAVVLIWSLLFYPLVWALVLGQIALLAFASLTAGIWATLNRREWLAGLALGLSLVKPNLSAGPVLAIVIFAAITRRYRLIAAVVSTILVLVATPMIAVPDWPVSFALRLTEYLEYTPFVPAVVLLGNLCCGGASSVAIVALSLVLVGATIYGWRDALRTMHDEHLLWAIGMTLIATASLAPRFATVNQVILLLPAIGLFGYLARKGVFGALGIVMLMAFWGITLWALTAIPPISVADPRYPVEHRVLSPILPASMAVLWIGIKLRTRIANGQSMEVVPSDA